MTIQVATFLNLVNQLSQLTKIPVNDLLGRLHLDPHSVEDLSAHLPWQYGTDIFPLAYTLSGNRYFGLSVGFNATPMILGQELGMFVQVCPDFRTLLREFVAFSALMGQMVQFVFHENGHEAALRYKALTAVRQRSFEAYRGTVEVNAASVVTLTRLLTQHAVRILRLEFDFPGSPALQNTYRQAFGPDIPLAFDCAFCGVIFSYECLGLQNPYFQVKAFQALRNDLQDRLRQHNGALAPFDTIRNLLEQRYFQRRLPELGLEGVAEQLHLSPRQLQRLLQSEHCTFLDIRNKVKRELTEKFLLYKTNQELCDLLKFADVPAFIRWYKAQYGMPPGQMRRQYQAAR